MDHIGQLGVLEIEREARNWARIVNAGGITADVVEGRSTIGGGSLPGGTLPTWLLALTTPSADRFAAQLRRAEPPIVARIDDGRLLFDPRTVFPDQEEPLLAAILTNSEKSRGDVGSKSTA